MMDMQSRNQYLKQLRKDYLRVPKKTRGKLLDEAEKRTGLARKYLIRKLKDPSNLDRHESNKKKRPEYYDGHVKEALVKLWRIFDHPCGQRLKPLLETEVDRLRKQKELDCSDDVAEKLKKISFRTIDEKLQHQKEVDQMKYKYRIKENPLLYQKIPVKISDEWDREIPGNIQADLVEHCGRSPRGEYVCTLSNADIATGWWEGEATMGKGQRRVFRGVKKARSRFPFHWLGMHCDNGTEFINAHLFNYTQEEKLDFSRSRPYKKNDNCFVEQKNWTHVRKNVGYLRYDTEKELDIMNDLFRNELRLYKNFFQPVMKLASKERIGGRIKRKYDKPKTPYQRALESKQVSGKVKQELEEIYDSLNPAELKREIDNKLLLLYVAYQKKNQNDNVKNKKKLKPISVTSLIAQPEAFR